MLHQTEKVKGKWQERKRRGAAARSVKTPRAGAQGAARARRRRSRRAAAAAAGHARGAQRESGGKLTADSMSNVPAVTVGGLLEARPESVGLPVELLAGARGLEPPHHQPLHPEDRPGARRLSRVPAARARADLRRERSALPREPRPARRAARRCGAIVCHRRAVRPDHRRPRGAARPGRSKPSGPACRC